jgi:hypothetical protein
MATAGSQGKAAAPPAGHARERTGASETVPRDRGTAHRRRASGRGRGTRWAKPDLWANPNLRGTPRTWGDSHAAGHSVSRFGTSLGAQNASGTEGDPDGPRQRSADALRGGLPPGGIVERRPAASTAGAGHDRRAGRRARPPAATPARGLHLRDSPPQGAASRRPGLPRSGGQVPLWLHARQHDARYCRTRARARLRWRSSTRTGVRRRGRLVRDGIGWRLTPRARTRPGPARTSPPGACAPGC